MDKELERILDICMEDIRQGKSVEDCLARYPRMAAELEPLLRTTLAVHRTSHMPMRPEFKAAARSRLLASVKAATPELKHRRPIISWRWRWVTGLAVFVLVTTGWGTVALANNSLPDDTLYPVKIAAEEVKIALTPGTVRKAKLAADMIDERTREIKELAKMKRIESIERANKRLDLQQQQLATIVISEDVEAGQPQTQLETLLVESSARQTAALREALTEAPESVKPAINRALQNSEAWKKATLQQVVEKKPAVVKPDASKAGSKTITPRKTPTPKKVATAAPKTTPRPTQPVPSKKPEVTPRATQKPPVTTPRPTPVPKPRGFIKSEDGLAYIECLPCSPEELKQYLERVHKQALLEGKPFRAVASFTYSYEDKKLVKQDTKKLYRVVETADSSIRIELECGACEVRTLEALLKRTEDIFKSVVTTVAPSKRPIFFYSVTADGRRFNAVTLFDKNQVNARRPALIASYPWPLDSSNELAYRTIVTFSSNMRYTREEFITEWLATWILKGMSDQQYNARLTELKSGKAYTISPESFNKTRLATDIVVALRAEGFSLERIAVLLTMIEGKNVNWNQFKDVAKQMTGKDAPTLNYIDRGVQLWRARGAAQK